MSTAAPEISRQLVVFSLGAEEFALPITDVQEIIRYEEPRAVASSTPWVRGVISLRGKILPVCDLAARLGVARDGEGDSTAKIVIVEAGDHVTAGVIVDEVQEVLTIEGDQLDAVPGAHADFIDGVARVEDRLIMLLDPETLLSGPELRAA